MLFYMVSLILFAIASTWFFKRISSKLIYRLPLTSKKSPTNALSGFKILCEDAIISLKESPQALWQYQFLDLKSKMTYSSKLLKSFINSLSEKEILEIWPQWELTMHTLALESAYNENILLEEEKNKHEEKSINKAYYQVAYQLNNNFDLFHNKITQFQFNYFLENKEIIN